MANYTQNYNDLHVMPDRHSTGCKGTLTSYTELFPSHTGGLLYFKKDSPTLLENLDFTGATPYFSKTDYTQPFIFRNCKFDSNFTKYNIQVTSNAGDSGLKINCYDCSFLNADSASYSDEPVFYFENCFFQGAMGDCMKLGTGITIKNCYSAGKCGAATGAHADGIQWSKGANDSWSIDGLRIDNLTIAPTTYANACFYFDHERGTNYHYTMTEHTLKNMWCNGGGYTIYVVASNNIQYDASKTYALGDVCTYPDRNVDEHAYRCIVAIDTAEEWNSSHWESVPRTVEGIYTVENFVFEDTWISTNYNHNAYSWGNSIVDDSDVHMISTPYVTSVWKESDGIHFLATNYTNVEKNIIVKTESNTQTFTLPAHPNKNGAGETSWDNLPIDKEFVISGEEYLVAFDTTESTENQIRFVEFEVPTRNKIDSIELPTGTYELKDTNGFYAEDIATVINEDSTDEEIPSALAVYNLGSTSGYELKSNKLTSLTSTATDDNYMSAKWLYDLLGWLQS